jgi:hypothetical protein
MKLRRLSTYSRAGAVGQQHAADWVEERGDFGDGYDSECGAGRHDMFGRLTGDGEGDGSAWTPFVLACVDQDLQCRAINLIVRARQP